MTMHPASAHTIRYATGLDQGALNRLAELDSQRPIRTPALVAEVRGKPAAALSLIDGRAVADPFQRTAALVSMLRLRAEPLGVAERTPSLRERIGAAVKIRRGAARTA
jgi:hypothetical protein